MAKVSVKLSLPGINRLMRSEKVQAQLDRLGRDMAADAGEGFEYVAKPHRYTARGYVQVASVEGARRQARDAVLERVMTGRR
ncbi:hypothetical protein [Microbacterium sp. KNMS]